MNKRQKKKLFKQITGKNPPKKMKYSGKSYHRAMNKPWGGNKKGSGCTDKTVCRHRNQHFRSFGKFIRSKYEKCGKYNKNIDSTPQKKR